MVEGRTFVFNDVLNIIYGYMVPGQMVKDHLNNQRGNPLSPLQGLLFFISSKGSFICTIQHTGYHLAQPLLYHLWSTGWNEKKLNGSTIRDGSGDP